MLLTSLLLITATFACDSKREQKKSKVQKISYTHLKECSETISNENAAYSNLKCPNVGPYNLTIGIQQPLYFTINLKHEGKSLNSEFEILSNEHPLETKSVIEWHLIDGQPRFMIFRLGWETEDQPFKSIERLIASYVTDQQICPLATFDTQKNKNADSMARQFIESNLTTIKTGPKKVEML